MIKILFLIFNNVYSVTLFEIELIDQYNFFFSNNTRTSRVETYILRQSNYYWVISSSYTRTKDACTRKAYLCFSRTINQWLHPVCWIDQFMKYLRDLHRGLKNFYELPVILCLRCIKPRSFIIIVLVHLLRQWINLMCSASQLTSKEVCIIINETTAKY